MKLCRLESQRVEVVVGHKADVSAIVSLGHVLQGQNVDVFINADFEIFGSGQDLVAIALHFDDVGLGGHFCIPADLFQPFDMRNLLL